MGPAPGWRPGRGEARRRMRRRRAWRARRAARSCCARCALLTLPGFELHLRGILRDAVGLLDVHREELAPAGDDVEVAGADPRPALARQHLVMQPVALNACPVRWLPQIFTGCFVRLRTRSRQEVSRGHVLVAARAGAAMWPRRAV